MNYPPPIIKDKVKEKPTIIIVTFWLTYREGMHAHIKSITYSVSVWLFCKKKEHDTWWFSHEDTNTMLPKLYKEEIKPQKLHNIWVDLNEWPICTHAELELSAYQIKIFRKLWPFSFWPLALLWKKWHVFFVSKLQKIPWLWMFRERTWKEREALKLA